MTCRNPKHAKGCPMHAWHECEFRLEDIAYQPPERVRFLAVDDDAAKEEGQQGAHISEYHEKDGRHAR